MSKRIKSDLLTISNDENAKRAAELVIANKEKAKREAEIVVANKEKVKRSSEKTISDLEKDKLVKELLKVNKELAFQIREKEKKMTELVIANEELAFQIREKEKRTEELANTNRELEAFSYTVSHDLRAPLRHINGYVDLLLSRYYDSLPEKARHYLDTISDSSHHMGMLIDQLLQFSRSGRQEKVLSAFDMNEVVQEVFDSIIQDIPERKIEYLIDALPHVNGDHAMLKLVWTNLISNAVKFTSIRDKAKIEVSVLEEKEDYTFSIQDNGVGFDMQYADKLFGVFQRLHQEEDFEGIGIGLANVQRIILRHKGRIWAEAEPDKGARFNFTLPKYKEIEK